MAYRDFSLDRLRKEFGINNKVQILFDNIEKSIKPSDWLKTTLEKTSKVNAKTEKAKSETIVFPILLEIKDRNDDFISVYSGESLQADEERGLKGECDFIITKNIESYSINYPILQIVEAKKHDIDLGIPQCAAQMLGAKIYNEQNETEINSIYGCVTTGDNWLFLKLEDNTLIIDKHKYYFDDLEKLLSVFQQILDYYKNELKIT